MTVAVVGGLPQPLAAEIVQQYGDVLRVGRVSVNGCEVCWKTSGSTSSQLDAFSAVFYEALRKLPETTYLDDPILHQAVYWFCKVVSINYAFCEVLDVLKEKVGKRVSIKTSGQGGRPMVDYGVVVQPDKTMQVYVSWREKGNIIHCDPKTAKKKIKGTLTSLVTEFPLPPSPCFAPAYSVHMKMKRSYKQKILSKVVSFAKKPKPRVSPQIFLESPLQSRSSLNMEGSVTGCSTEAPSSDVSLDGDFLTQTKNMGSLSWDCSDSDSDDASVNGQEIASPLHFRARSVIATPCIGASALRVC